MAGSYLLHLNTGANSISNYFYLINGSRIESWKVTGDQSKLSGHERFYISVTHACEVGDRQPYSRQIFATRDEW
jgi:hypothetical protein